MHYRCVLGWQMNKINDTGIRLEWLVEMFLLSSLDMCVCVCLNLLHSPLSFRVFVVSLDVMRSYLLCVSNFLVAVYHIFVK